jgi:hypothetical protein
MLRAYAPGDAPMTSKPLAAVAALLALLAPALSHAQVPAGPAPGPAQAPAQAPVLSGAEAIERLASWWTGAFSNERQALNDRLQAEPDWPESVRLLRDMRVRRLDAPAIGPVVLYLEEIKSDQPDKAHRQRVMTFNWKAETGEIEVEQLFFSTELAYDRHFIPAEDVARMKRADFTRAPGCDLFFAWDAARQRFKGGMRPRACQYVHPGSGEVFAEFDMILDRHRLWYRDRSIRIPGGAVRGEIDGFSWLRFDRLSDAPTLAGGDRISREQMLRRMPLTARMEGVWEGTFRRYDAAGALQDTLPSRIIIRFLPDGSPNDYAQTNILRPPGRPEQRIESVGRWDVDRLRFSNARLEGWAQDVAADPAGLTSVFHMTYKDGSRMIVSEVVSLAPDGRRRSRATQYMVDGQIIRRTLIDETKVSDTPE